MINRPNIGPTLRAFDVYGRGWFSPPPKTASMVLGAARIRMADHGLQLEYYGLVREAGYWLLVSRLGDRPPRLLARVSETQLPADFHAAGQALLRELWSLRDPGQAHLLGMAQAGALEADFWDGLVAEHGADRQAASPEGENRSLDQRLLGQGLCVETVSGVMGTAEHLLLPGRAGVSAA